MSGVYQQTNVLYRTPWRPPVAVSAEGMNVTLEDGRVVIDAVGGAAVACIGNGHPVVQQAIKDQVEKVSCVFILTRHTPFGHSPSVIRRLQHATLERSL